MIVVSNMDRSVEFYRDKLGIPLKFQSPEWTEFATGATTLALHGGGIPAEGPPSGDLRNAPARVRLVSMLRTLIRLTRNYRRREFGSSCRQRSERARESGLP
jgi:catechol 2,3-dioxygenase-like lactoylglutathione lyase family enzyme